MDQSSLIAAMSFKGFAQFPLDEIAIRLKRQFFFLFWHASFRPQAPVDVQKIAGRAQEHDRRLKSAHFPLNLSIASDDYSRSCE
jgi:hypothetical protein